MLWALPPGVADWLVQKQSDLETWPEERLWALKNLDALATQLTKIIVATKPAGMYGYTKRNARHFSARGRRTL